MPCMGPGTHLAKERTSHIIDDLYSGLEKIYNQEDPGTNYWLLKLAQKVTKSLFNNYFGHDIYGKNYSEYSRYAYMLAGFLIGKLPEMTVEYYVESTNYTGTKKQLDPKYFNFTKDQLQDEIADLFFMFDCEDF